MLPDDDVHAGAAAIAARIPREHAVARMTAAVRRSVPAFEHLSEDSYVDILAGLDRSLRRWARFLATETMPADADFEPLREWTRMRATEGFRLEDLLRSFGVLHRSGWELLQENAQAEELAALVELAGLLARYIERVSVIVTETYLAERELLVSEEERHTRSLLERISNDAELEGAERETADRLGVPLDSQFTPFAASLPGGRPHRHAALASRLRRRGFSLAVTQSDCVVGLAWSALELEDLDEGPEVLLAIGERTPGSELAAAREEVALLIEHARRIGLTGCVRVEDHLLEVLLDSSPRLSRRLRERVLGPLAQDAELTHTLRVLLDCRFDRKATSAALHIHRNTLAYRLGRIEQIAELDLSSPRDLACVYAALRGATDDASGSAPR